MSIPAHKYYWRLWLAPFTSFMSAVGKSWGTPGNSNGLSSSCPWRRRYIEGASHIFWHLCNSCMQIG
jgi:hypothetical protein